MQNSVNGNKTQKPKKLFDNLLSKKTYSPDTNYYQEAKTWYQENYESVCCSRNRYRLLSLMTGLLLVLAVTAIITIMPLKKYYYRILTVNSQTGEISMLKEMEEGKFNASWLVTRYFINQYVYHRNRYYRDDFTRSFNIVLAMSDKQIADSYYKDSVDTNPMSLINSLGKDHYREVTDITVNQLNANTAIARFTTITHNRNNPNDIVKENFQTVIRWDYQNISESLKDRDKNPLGFVVTYYQNSPAYTGN